MTVLYKDTSGLVLIVIFHQFKCSYLSNHYWRAAVCWLIHDAVSSCLLGLWPLIVIPLYIWQRD